MHHRRVVAQLFGQSGKGQAEAGERFTEAGQVADHAIEQHLAHGALLCLGLQLGETCLGGGEFALQDIGSCLELGVLRLRCCQCAFCLVAKHDASCGDPVKVE